MKTKTVFGVVRSERDAENLVSALHREGFARDDVSLFEPPSRREPQRGAAPPGHFARGALVGAGTGVAVGLVGLALTSAALGPAALDTGSIPIVLGVTAAVGALGSAIGGILRALSEREQEPPVPAKARAILVTLRAERSAETDIARVIFTSSGAENVCRVHEL